jgi:hypothetical protein
MTTPTVTEQVRNGNLVGGPVELGRYRTATAERMIVVQRVNGVVRFLPGQDVVLVQPPGGSEDDACRFPFLAVDAARPLDGSGEPIGEES